MSARLSAKSAAAQILISWFKQRQHRWMKDVKMAISVDTAAVGLISTCEKVRIMAS